MVIEINWTTHSLDDIENIADFISKDSEHFALIQIEKFFERVKILEKHPRIGRVVPEIDIENIRQLIEGNYRIIYRIVSQSRIDIITVHHSSKLLSNEPFERSD